MECRVTATAKSGRYRIVTDYLTDPSRNTVVMRAQLKTLDKEAASFDKRSRSPSISASTRR